MTETSRLWPCAIQGLIAAGGLLLWFVVTQSGEVSPLFLPAPDAVVNAWVALVRSDEFWPAVGVTLTTIAAAYILAAVAGLLTGWLITRSPLLTRAFEPLVSGIFAIPITLFFPLFILLFGIGQELKLAYGAVYGFFPVALNTIAGFAHVDRRLVDAARCMGLSRFGLFRHVLLPAASPVIFTGLRVGFFICFASVLGGEAIASAAGIGHNIALSAELFEPARMYAWIVCVVAAALVLTALVSTIERRFRDS